MRSNTAGAEGHGDPWGSTVKDGIDQRSVFGFRRDRKKDESGNLSAATRRVTAENAPVSDFCEVPKDMAGLWAGPSWTVLSKGAPLNFGGIAKKTNRVI